MKHVILILLVVLCACSHNDTVYSVSPELEPYVTSFYNEASLRGKDIPKINLIAELGQCQAVIDVSKDGNQWMLKLDPDFYQYYTKGQIEAIIFHELGKIILKREIISGPLSPTPLSIMNPYYKFGEYGAKRTPLLDELFK